MFTLTFTTNNAAFDDLGAATETARILRTIAAKVESGELEGWARDANGNRVGYFVLNGDAPNAAVRSILEG